MNIKQEIETTVNDALNMVLDLMQQAEREAEKGELRNCIDRVERATNLLGGLNRLSKSIRTAVRSAEV